MDFDRLETGALFVALIAVGVLGLIATGMMATRTVLMMVTPSMVVFGLLSLAIGVKHGEYRTNTS